MWLSAFVLSGVFHISHGNKIKASKLPSYGKPQNKCNVIKQTKGKKQDTKFSHQVKRFRRVHRITIRLKSRKKRFLQKKKIVQLLLLSHLINLSHEIINYKRLLPLAFSKGGKRMKRLLSSDMFLSAINNSSTQDHKLS